MLARLALLQVLLWCAEGAVGCVQGQQESVAVGSHSQPEGQQLAGRAAENRDRAAA